MSLTAQKLFDGATHYLQRYASSSENLRRVLQRKIKRRRMKWNDVPDEAETWIDGVVEKCVRLNLVNDALYAESRVISLRRQGRSKHYITQNLKQKFVAKELIAKVLDEDESDDEKAVARFVQKKRLGRDTSPEGVKKDLGKIMRAGFSYAAAKNALKASVDDEHEFFDESEA